MAHRRVAGKLRNFFRRMTFENWTSSITAGATVFTAGSLLVAACAYRDQERSSRLERTHHFMTDAEKYVDEHERMEIIAQFPGRWQREVRFCLAKEQAEKFLKIALDPKADPAKYHRWDLARKHLNQVETVAFPYVHKLGDREILATSTCVYMAKSNKYFRHLIAIFGRYFGAGQSWQVIPEALSMMADDYGRPVCTTLQSEKEKPDKDNSHKLTYEFPAPRDSPAEGEEECGN